MDTVFIGNPTSTPPIVMEATATVDDFGSRSFSYTTDDFTRSMAAQGIKIIGAGDGPLDRVGPFRIGDPPPYTGQQWWGDPPPTPSIPLMPFGGHCPGCHPHTTIIISGGTLGVVPQYPRPAPAYSNPYFAGKRKRRATCH